jgi:hypothetical protein
VKKLINASLKRTSLYLALIIGVVASSVSAQQSTLDQEISLSDDRKHLEELRKDIPEDTKKENDELAFILKLFEDKKRKPNQIRQEFNRRLSSYRKKKQKYFKKLNKEYSKQEKTQRKSFLAQSKKKRDEFLKKESSKQDRDDFFKEERSLNDEFFSEEREKRRDFESEVRAQQREFEQELNDRRKDFEHRMKEFQDAIRAEKDQAQNFGLKQKSEDLLPTHQSYLEDFKQIPRTPGEKLAPTQEQ